jgi:hypothetical protein
MSAVARAIEIWGAELPEWVLVLAKACDNSSQGIISGKLDYSATVVSQVITRKYPGNLEKVEKAVRGALMKEVVSCPVMRADIPSNACLTNQRSGLNTATRQSVQLYRTCPTCIHAQPRGESC